MHLMLEPNFKLIGVRSELLVSTDSRSWHVLDEPDLFNEGLQLRKAFGVTWAKGLYKEPPFGILQSVLAPFCSILPILALRFLSSFP